MKKHPSVTGCFATSSGKVNTVLRRRYAAGEIDAEE
jgi:uncharacterized membrane protein